MIHCLFQGSDPTQTIFRDGGFAASFILTLQHRLPLLSAHAVDVEDNVFAMAQAVRLACILYLVESDGHSESWAWCPHYKVGS